MGINLRSPLFIVLLTIVIDRLGESLIFPILPFLVERFNFDALSLTLLFSAFAAAQFIAAPLLGALSDHWGRRPVLLICIAGTACPTFSLLWRRFLGCSLSRGLLMVSRGAWFQRLRPILLTPLLQQIGLRTLV